MLTTSPDHRPADSRAPFELLQTEWCPASHRVRQRLTELGLIYVVRQVPVERPQRTELLAATGQLSIPVLLAGGEQIVGEESILAYLNTHFAEPPEAERHRDKAARARRKDLDDACLKLSAPTA